MYHYRYILQMLAQRTIPIVFFRLNSGRGPLRDWLKGACHSEATIEQVEIKMMGTKNLGSSFDAFLAEEGLLEDATATAVKRYIAFQLAEKMSAENLSKSEMARRMETSRSALDRLLDPANPAVTLRTLQSAAHALGGRLKVELDFRKRMV